MSEQNKSTEITDKEVVGLKQIIVGYLYHWKLFLGAFLIALIISIFYLVFYPKTYEIYSSVQLQDESSLMSSTSMGLGEAAGLMKSFGLSGIQAGGLNLDDEIAIFMSTDLTNKMVLELGLNVEYIKPYTWNYKLYNTTPLLITAEPEVFKNLADEITLNITYDKKVTVAVKVGKEKRGTLHFESLPAQIELAEGVFVLSKNAMADSNEKIKLKIAIRPSTWVAEEILDGLNIEEYSKTSNVVELTYFDYEKRRAIDLLNSLIQQYNSRAGGIKKEEADVAFSFIEGRINELVADLLNVEELIEKFKQRNSLTDLTYDVQFFAEQMKELQIKIIEVKTQSYTIDLMNAYISDPINKYNLVPGLLSVKDGESAGALTVYNEALVERTRILNTTSNDHPSILAINEQIDKLRDAVFLTIRNAKQGIQLTLDDLTAKEKLLYSRMSDVPAQEREFIELKRQQEILQGVYLILLQKREEIALTMGQNRLKASVVDVPFVKKKRVAPRKLFAAIGLLLFTILVPVGYLFAKEQFIGLKKEVKKQRNKDV